MTEPVELSGNQCLEQLRRHGAGRVAFGTPMGPRIAAVTYTLRGGEILFRTVPYSEVGTYAPGREVAFEIDDADEAGHFTVVALGRAEIVEPPDGLAEAGPARDGPGAAHRDARWLRVLPHDLVGLLVSEEEWTGPGT